MAFKKTTKFPNGVESIIGFFGPFVGKINNPTVVALTPIATADATDLATALTLANATKAKVNAIIAALQA